MDMRRARRKAVVAAVVGATAVTAVHGGFTSASAQSANPVDEVLAMAPPPPPRPPDPFYTPPAPLPTGKPGDVIKSRMVDAPGFATGGAFQFMYLSEDFKGVSTPVTGALLKAPVPAEGNPVVVITPGTRGLGDHCAPSQYFSTTTIDPRQPDYSNGEYQRWLEKGVSLVITDYIGGGTPLDQSYLIGKPEGQSGLDALRAAIRFAPDDGITDSSPLGISGYSQGGQAASWAAQLQPKYAPELNVKGVLAGGVPYDMVQQWDHLNGNPTGGAGLALAIATGLQANNPSLDLNKYVTEKGKQVFERVRNSCVIEELGAFGTISVGDVTQPDVSRREDFRAEAAKSQLGKVAPKVPAFIYYGSADTIVPPSFNRALYSDWCERGGAVQLQLLPGGEHLGVIVTGPASGGQDWLDGQLKGEPAPAGCTEVDLLGQPDGNGGPSGSGPGGSGGGGPAALPSCARRKLTIRAPRRLRRNVRVRVGGKRAKLRGRRVVVRLKGRRATQRFKIVVKGKTRSGRKVRLVRRVRLRAAQTKRARIVVKGRSTRGKKIRRVRKIKPCQRRG